MAAVLLLLLLAYGGLLALFKLLPMLAMLTLLNLSDRLVRNCNVELEKVG